MDYASADEAAARERRIAQRVDQRSAHLMQFDAGRLLARLLLNAFIVYLAYQYGARGWPWLWLAADTSMSVYACYLTRVLARPDCALSAKGALQRWALMLGADGVLTAAILPWFFSVANDATLFAMTLMVGCLAAVLAAWVAGALTSYLAWLVPICLVTMSCWFWHGQTQGYAMAFFSGTIFPIFLATVVRDQRRMLTELMRTLDDKEMLSQSLQRERDRAEAMSAAKTRFFAAASHDLRQPLHALSINATTLNLVAQRSDNPIVRDLSQGINSALRQSRGLLDSLLDISRLDARAVEPRMAPHELGAVLHALHDQFAAVAAQRGLALDIMAGDEQAEPVWALTDADQLMRILGNLVDNAIKFTPKGQVSLSLQREPPNRVLIRVTDTGPGIAESERERVFEEFYQIGNPSRDRSQGLGLGLAIVQRTAHMLDIDLRLSSASGQGTTFELRLLAAKPVAPQAAEAVPEAPAANEVPAQPGAALVVDDEPDVVASLCIYLQQLGWDVRGAADGAAAEKILLDGFRADVLVVDFRLRNETGIDVIARLRRHDPHLPAVIVTGDTAPARLRELASAAAGVLHKPIDGQHLARVLTQTIAARADRTAPKPG